ncbi:MAG TPA: hypothetical protein VN228_07495 [Pyrinomonadaceae bacterium]|nr:hypothetical protein [Pyrinomonadaceae bacterium]
MKGKFLPACSLLTLAACLACAQTASRPASADAPQPAQAGAVSRRAEGRTLVSADRPAVRIRFDDDFKYVGAQSFVLYEVAGVEQHFFVDADKDGRIRRLYWVQFEGYLPSNTHAYDYSDVKETINLGGLEFRTDAVAVNIARVLAQRKDSDGAHARAFLESKGYRVAGNDFMWRRLIHLTDETRRHELLIIYLEDMAPTGLTAGDVMGQGRASARWPEISAQLLRRAAKGMKIEKVGD